MSIKSEIQNITGFLGDSIDSVLNSATSKIENIIGTASTGLSNIYAGGFIGMSQSGMEALNTAIDKYCRTIEEAINAFNDEASRADAYKGEISEAVHAYVEAMKKLLSSYVSTMRKEQEEAILAYNQLHASEKSFAQDVQSDSSNIESDAANIRVEATNISLE